VAIKNTFIWEVTPYGSSGRFLQEPHDVTSKKTAFFIGTAVKTSNLTYEWLYQGTQSRQFDLLFPLLLGFSCMLLT
jgi:hypothetical protein